MFWPSALSVRLFHGPAALSIFGDSILVSQIDGGQAHPFHELRKRWCMFLISNNVKLDSTIVEKFAPISLCFRDSGWIFDSSHMAGALEFMDIVSV